MRMDGSRGGDVKVGYGPGNQSFQGMDRLGQLTTAISINGRTFYLRIVQTRAKSFKLLACVSARNLLSLVNLSVIMTIMLRNYLKVSIALMKQ